MLPLLLFVVGFGAGPITGPALLEMMNEDEEGKLEGALVKKADWKVGALCSILTMLWVQE